MKSRVLVRMSEAEEVIRRLKVDLSQAPRLLKVTETNNPLH